MLIGLLLMKRTKGVDELSQTVQPVKSSEVIEICLLEGTHFADCQLF